MSRIVVEAADYLGRRRDVRLGDLGGSDVRAVIKRMLAAGAVVAAVAETLAGSPATSLAHTTSVPTPTVVGPVAGVAPGDASHDYPFLASPLDLPARGYVEEETSCPARHAATTTWASRRPRSATAGSTTRPGSSCVGRWRRRRSTGRSSRSSRTSPLSTTSTATGSSRPTTSCEMATSGSASPPSVRASNPFRTRPSDSTRSRRGARTARVAERDGWRNDPRRLAVVRHLLAGRAGVAQASGDRSARHTDPDVVIALGRLSRAVASPRTTTRSGRCMSR